MTKEIAEAIEAATNELLKEPRRKHLGASQIGASCLRQAWYAFRWAAEKAVEGRMRRLWRRGHEEEHRIVRWLRATGYEVRDYSQRLMYHDGSDCYLCEDWDAAPSIGGGEADDRLWAECDDVSEDRTHIERAERRGEGPKQWGFSQHGGHYSGSSDGKVRGPGLPPGWGLLENKTHNDKSYKDLVDKGVLVSKKQHWIQAQIYMYHLDLAWCLYFAVNKNDDAIHCEIIEREPMVGARYEETAFRLVNEKQAPQRLSENPSWYECKWCEFLELCHYDATPDKNCRSCVFAEPTNDKQWRCTKFHQDIPASFIPTGCQDWTPIK